MSCYSSLNFQIISDFVVGLILLGKPIHLLSLIGFDRHLQPSSNYYMLLGVLKEIARKVRDGNYGNKPT